MKKFLFTILGLALLVPVINTLNAATSMRADRDNPPYISKNGSNMENKSVVAWGAGNRNDQSCNGFVGRSIVTITAGDILVSVSSTPYAKAVSKSATLGNVDAVGVAMADSTYGNDVFVCTNGFINVTCDPGLVITQGMKLIQGAATAGAAAGISQSAVGAGGNSLTSAILGRSVQVKTTSSTDLRVLIELLGR